jgi:hypothetical protein
MFGQVIQRLIFLFANISPLLFVSWAIRSKYDLDESRDRRAKVVRWSIILGSALVIAIPVVPRSIALPFVIPFFAFVLWPNFAVGLSRVARRRADPPQSNLRGNKDFH